LDIKTVGEHDNVLDNMKDDLLGKANAKCVKPMTEEQIRKACKWAVLQEDKGRGRDYGVYINRLGVGVKFEADTRKELSEKAVAYAKSKGLLIEK
jgi:hypothetical protein